MPQQQQQKKKKKGHAPAHQNQFAFHHNPKSKKTDRILNAPIQHVCRKCHDKLVWRKQYRKYKPLTQPSICNICSKRNITAAYHTICIDCGVNSLKANERLAEWHAQQQEQQERGEGGCTSADTADTDSPAVSSTRICAICVTEPALADGNEHGDRQTIPATASDGRPLRLRELKTIERRQQQQHQSTISTGVEQNSELAMIVDEELVS